MKVFTTCIFAAKITWVPNFYFPNENKLGRSPNLFFHEENKSWTPNLFFRRENKSCKDLHGIKFTFYS